MFIFDQETIDYKDPWNWTFEERFRKLVEKPKRIAYFYETPDNSTFRYRVYNMIQVINHFSDEISTSASYFCNDDIDHFKLIAESCHILIICRTKYSDSINRLIGLAKARGAKVFFDIDDFVFNPDYVHLILDTLDQDLNHPQVWDFWFAYISRLGATLKLCDRVITTNQFLADRVKDFSQKPVHIIPNFMNKEQIEISSKIFESKKKNNFKRNDKIHIGYFSGTPTHNKDFQVVSDALCQILSKRDDVILRIAGYMDLPSNLKSLTSQIEFIPFQDFINLQNIVGSTEINLIPLQNNIFTNCKSDLKFFESGILGTLSIASPGYLYFELSKRFKYLYIAKSYEWFNAIENIIVSLNRETKYNPIYPELVQLVYDNYSWTLQLPRIQEALGHIEK